MQRTGTASQLMGTLRPAIRQASNSAQAPIWKSCWGQASGRNTVAVAKIRRRQRRNLIRITAKAQKAQRTVRKRGRVEEGRGRAQDPCPFPAHQTRRADFRHPAFRQSSHESPRGSSSRHTVHAEASEDFCRGESPRSFGRVTMPVTQEVPHPAPYMVGSWLKRMFRITGIRLTGSSGWPNRPSEPVCLKQLAFHRGRCRGRRELQQRHR